MNKKLTEREKARGVDPNAPRGISFYSVKSDETRYARTSAQIQGYINSSDRGINASRGQDKGWRLDAEWVKKIRDFKNDEDKMDTLAAKLRLEDGVSPSSIQILHYIYGRQIRAYARRRGENENEFEQKYLKQLSSQPEEPVSEDTKDSSEANKTDKPKTVIKK